MDDVDQGNGAVRRRTGRPGTLAAAAWVAALLTAACTPDDRASVTGATGASTAGRPDAARLPPVALPDLSAVEPSVRAQVEEQYAVLTSAVAHPDSAPGELSRVYGEMGHLFMATRHRETAEACYLHAWALAPNERRWPYYLGHVSRTTGAFARAATFFAETLAISPDDVPTLLWLGEVHLAQGRPEAAVPPFEQALALEPRSVLARFGLGRAALARRDHARAAEHLEEALALDPRATSLHYPLAMAFRGLGELDKAEAHLRQRGNRPIERADPLLKVTDVVLRSPLAYDGRGTRALERGDWTGAAAYFRQGVELAPANSSLRQKLGIALFMMDDTRGAGQQLAEAARLAPDSARTQYSLGVLLQARGRDRHAVDRFAAALRFDPAFVDARVWMAGVLRRIGRPGEALVQYAQVVDTDSRSGGAAFGYAAALVDLGRYREARARLADLVSRYPERPIFSHALARLLAAAPDARVRDGLAAMAVLDALPAAQRVTDFGETLAMALAELEYYEDAARWQREGIAAARRAGREDLVPRMAEKLGQYESGRPWRNDAPLGLDPLSVLTPF